MQPAELAYALEDDYFISIPEGGVENVEPGRFVPGELRRRDHKPHPDTIVLMRSRDLKKLRSNP